MHLKFKCVLSPLCDVMVGIECDVLFTGRTGCPLRAVQSHELTSVCSTRRRQSTNVNMNNLLLEDDTCPPYCHRPLILLFSMRCIQLVLCSANVYHQ